MSPTPSSGEFTGRHMLVVMLAFFSVIIAVNVIMAMFARSSWTGFVVENSYVASQQFNEKARQGRAQAALGWTSTLAIAEGRIRYGLADASGKVVAVAGGTATFRRPAYASEDQSVPLSREADGALGAARPIRDGIWIVEFLVEAGLDRPFRETRRLVVRNGALQ